MTRRPETPPGGPHPFLVALGLGLLLAPARADLLIESTGAETQGRLEAMDADRLTFRAASGAARTLPRTQVARVELYRDLGGPPGARVEDLDDPVLTRALARVADRQAYPDAGAVNLFLGHTVTFEADGTRRLSVRNVVRVLEERGKEEGTVHGQWLADRDTFEVGHGRTILPDGSLRRLTGKGLRVSPVYGSTPEYDRLRRHLLTLPAVDVGSVVDWETHQTRPPRPDLPPWYRFVVAVDEPVLEGRVEVRVHQDADMVVHLSATDRVARSRRVEGDYRVEVFEFAGWEPGKDEDDLPPAAEIHPTIYVAPRRAWAEVAAGLASAVAAAVAPGPRVQAALAKLVEPGQDAAARYQAIAGWVAREIRLVGVGMSQFGFAPRSAEEVLATGTGNFLDKTLALHALLRAAGVGSRLFLVRDRFLAPTPGGEVRALQLFDDAAVQVDLGAGWVFRDADSDDLGPQDLPTAFHDVDALGLDGDAAGQLVRIPAPPLEADQALQVYRCRLEPDGTLVGERRLEVRGNSAPTVRGYRNLDEARLAQRMIRLNHAFHPRAELLGFDLQHVDDFTQDVVYVRRFRVPGYALKAGEKAMAFRLPGLVDSAADVGETTRRYPRAWRDRDLQRLEIQVDLPAGWRVLHLPEGVASQGQGWRYQGAFQAADAGLAFTSEYVRETFRVAPEGYPAFKAMRDARARLARQWVVVEMVR